MLSNITVSSIKLNRYGNKIHHCRTPVCVWKYSVIVLSILMAPDDFRYISCTSLIICSGIPAFCITILIPSSHMLSKACLKSMKLMKAFCLCSMLFQVPNSFWRVDQLCFFLAWTQLVLFQVFFQDTVSFCFVSIWWRMSLECSVG